MQRRVVPILAVLLAVIASGASEIPKSDKPAVPQPTPSAPSLALSPAVIMLKTLPGASSTHPMTITNLTTTRFRFVLEAFDVVIRDGQRVFVPAGETDGGIARSAVFDPAAIELNPGQAAEVRVTLTVPPEPRVRAVAAIFHGQTALASKGTMMFTGSLGTLITYNLSENIAIRGAGLAISPQTVNSNLAVSEQLENNGGEPLIANGTLAILKNSGELIGRVAIPDHRLLPGEKFDCTVEYPHNLRPGKYRALVSLEYQGGVRTSNIEFEVP